MLLSTSPFHLKKTLGYFLLLIAISNVCFAQTKDHYLQLLEGEASNLTLDNETKAKKPSTINTSTSSNSLPLGLSPEELFQYLKINYIGSYLFAKRLSQRHQKELYEFYKNNNDSQAIRTQIIALRKKQ